jgi:hypothetical protein
MTILCMIWSGMAAAVRPSSSRGGSRRSKSEQGTGSDSSDVDDDEMSGSASESDTPLSSSSTIPSKRSGGSAPSAVRTRRGQDVVEVAIPGDYVDDYDEDEQELDASVTKIGGQPVCIPLHHHSILALYYIID